MRYTLLLTSGLLVLGCTSEPSTAVSTSHSLRQGQVIVYRAGQAVAQSELVDLGPPEELGGTVLEGDPRLSARVDFSAGEYTAGVFQATRGKVLIHFPFTEHATIIRGVVALTDEYGNQHVFRPGDSYLIKQGSNIIWDVDRRRVQKVFFNRVEPEDSPGPMVVYERRSTVSNSELIDLGPPAELGGTVLAGDPKISARVDCAADTLTAGVFQATRGDVLIDFPFTEMATFHKGRVRLTDQTGATHVLRPGDSYLIMQDSQIMWEVSRRRVQKSFLSFVDVDGP